MLRLDRASVEKLIEHRTAFEASKKEAKGRMEFEAMQDFQEDINLINIELTSRIKPLAVKPIYGKKRSAVCLCGKAIKAKGLCSAHHQTYLRTGKVPVLVNNEVELKMLELVTPVATRPKLDLAKFVM
jgi:hypothetical protein